MAYSRTAGPFIGDLENFGLRNVVAAPSVGSAVIPDIVFCLYQMLFVSIFSPYWADGESKGDILSD